MQEFTTPMMKQYQAIKEQYKDCLLFYRLGDFYELFMEDAEIGSEVLNITLTGRPRGKDGRIPMAGVPYHAVDSYLAKLVQAGYKVAICEQVSLPNKYGVVDREVIRVVTPGTVLDEKALEKKSNNFIFSFVIKDKKLGIAVADISTGYFAAEEVEFVDLKQTLRDLLIKFNPTECILPENLYNDPKILKILKLEKGLNIYDFQEWEEYTDDSIQKLLDHFKIITLSGFGLDGKDLAITASAGLLGYLKVTQKSSLAHIRSIKSIKSLDYVYMDRSTMLNLELFSTIRERDTRGSLLYVLDQTITAMGGRLLKLWICQPLTHEEDILKRLESVEIFLNNSDARDQIRELLKQVIDIERLVSRLSVGLGNARDLVNLSSSLNTLISVRTSLESLIDSLDCKSCHGYQFLNQLISDMPIAISTAIEVIDRYIIDEPPISLREGGLIKTGISEQLDSLRNKINHSKLWIVELEKNERERTGISSLKVRFNKVFGFFIEISKSNLSLVPDNYMRKQTLVNGERFITEELKSHEEIILNAEEKINNLEYEIYNQVLQDVLKCSKQIQDFANSIAVLDCLTNFAYISQKEQYIKPKIAYSGEIQIKEGRHPVVEKLLEKNEFVPNDCLLNNSQSVRVLTGPNMAGKSVYLRQVAVIVLMAQIGCFVPAKSAYISLVDKIFVRSGASDMITAGLSTFMVEMVETAHILNHATRDSLIIMDEIGRGTSTYDGISIAWAVAQYLVSQDFSPKTLFATHYHELQELEEKFPEKIKNFHMVVEESEGDPIFLHTIAEGGAPSSFGIAVAKMAGVPEEVIKIALSKLSSLEKRRSNEAKENTQTSVVDPVQENFDFETNSIVERLIQKEIASLDLYQITPLQALNILAEIKNKLKLMEEKRDGFINID